MKKVRSTFGANGPNSENKHNALIDEFKLAHKKMFQNSLAVNIESLDKSRCKPSDASLPTLDKHVVSYKNMWLDIRHISKFEYNFEYLFL